MPLLRAALQDALGPLYRVEREVRPVGDCRLFVALELPGGPELLLKVLPGQLSLAVDSGVFEREVLLLAPRLGHPHLVAPKGAGRAGSFVFHTRPFVAGTTLRAWLARHGELPLRQAVTILHDVLAALAHAHAAGVAHGDLKPEHVLLADGGAGGAEGTGGAQVADTGIVDAVGRSLLGGAGAAGVASAALCAAPYVAPERRASGAGLGPRGPRDDMFALGVLAHEMLTGKPPAPEEESLEEVRTVPAWLGELVHRCLEPEPAARWADAAAALATVSRPSGGLPGGRGAGGSAG
jgi:eukaryotic-like serine/threonine-protein kinase